ncbi:MAG: hypothetical protein IPL35_09285 [Sphingobacteriales bacterium]|nr:hypothetical protein [Sphingobacteriales bacterium]
MSKDYLKPLQYFVAAGGIHITGIDGTITCSTYTLFGSTFGSYAPTPDGAFFKISCSLKPSAYR